MHIHPTRIAAILAAHPEKFEADLQAESVVAQLRAAREVLGADAPLDAQWSAEHGVEVFLVLVARDVVRDPLREISAPLLLAQGGEFEDVEEGLELAFPLSIHTDLPDGTAGVRELLGADWRWSYSAGELQARCAAALSELVYGYLPPRAFAVGTLGHLLQSGSWLLGCAAEQAGERLEIVETVFAMTPENMGHDRVRYGVVLQRDSAGDSARHELVQQCSLFPWIDLFDKPVSQENVPRLQAALLRSLCDEPNLDALLSALLTQPRGGSLAAWLPQQLAPDVFAALRVEHDGVWIQARTTGYRPPAVALERALNAYVEISCSTNAQLDLPKCWLLLGELPVDAVIRAGPTSAAEHAHAARLLEVWRAELGAYLLNRLRYDRLSELRADLSFGLSNDWTLWPLTLLEHALSHGLPPPPPVPPLTAVLPLTPQQRAELPPLRAVSEQRFTQLAGALVCSEHEPPEQLLAAFEVNGYLLTLRDAQLAPPWSRTSIWLQAELPLGIAVQSEAFAVLHFDDYSPYFRTVLDHDVFALRRLLEWLHLSVHGTPLDAPLHFAADEDEGFEARELRLSDWLRFDLPAPSDSRLADWRFQHYVASPKPLTYAPEYQARRAAWTAHWRAFLRSCVDPRFV